MALPMRMNISRRQLNTTSLVRVFEYRIAILWKLISSIFSMFSSSSGVLLSFFSLHCDTVSMVHVRVCGTRSISENGICSHAYKKKQMCVCMDVHVNTASNLVHISQDVRWEKMPVGCRHVQKTRSYAILAAGLCLLHCHTFPFQLRLAPKLDG